jgi:hypothetical protein
LPYFVDGLGGKSQYGFGSTVSGSAVRYNADWGAMLVEANEQTITFKFVAVGSGGTGQVIDSFTIDLAGSAASSSAMTDLMFAAPAPPPVDRSGDASASVQMMEHASSNFDLFFV